MSKTKPSTIKAILLTGAIAGFVLFTWACYIFNLLGLAMERTAWVFGSLLVIAVPIAVIVVSIRRNRKSGEGKGVGWVAVAFVAFCATVVVVAIVTDWMFGDWFRSMPGFWAKLPKGNLLLAGRVGWTYFALFVVLMAGLFFNQVFNRLGRILPKARPRRQRKPEQVEDDSHQPLDAESLQAYLAQR